MFEIEMLPAQRGDALWITYGEKSAPHHLVVDAGPAETIPTVVPELERRISALPGREGKVELLLVTHIDADHIQGVVALLSDARRVPVFHDIWFNGYAHHHPEVLGGMDAEMVTGSLAQHPDHWNRAFQGGAVMIPDAGPLPTAELAGGMRVTVLAPDRVAMTRLLPEWEEACRKAGVAPGGGAPVVRKSFIREGLLGGFEPDALAASKFSADPSPPNAAGIAVIAAYDGKRVLLLGDSSARPVLKALDRLEPRPHRFDAVKVAHHGSRRNTDLEFATAVQAGKWLVSTDGAKFGHPDPEAIARIVVGQEKPPTFAFNYVTEHISDIVDGAGDRYRVQLPRRRGTDYAEGITVRV